MSRTTYLAPLQQFLSQRHPQPDALWNYSEDNRFAPDWLLATPTSVWGRGYAQFPQGVPGGAPDYPLRECTQAEGPTQLCETVGATVTRPGAAPRKLLVGHSWRICEAVYETMVAAERLLDITMLNLPTGLFLDTMRNALAFISNKPAAQRPVIRILTSNAGINNLPFATAQPFLESLTKGLDPAQSMRIYVTDIASSIASWNHSKIVVADGRVALGGGHNMWDAHYLGTDPVFDVSMRLEGSAALHAQDYADNLWNYAAWRQAHLVHWASAKVVDTDRLYHAAYRPDASGGPCRIEAGVLPPPQLYADLRGSFPAPAAGSVPVLALGRGGNIRSSYILPTLYSHLAPFSEPSDDALVELLDMAKTSIRLSQQALRSPFWLQNPPLMRALAGALARGVDIDIVLSNPGAVAGGLGRLEAPYGGDAPAAVNAMLLQALRRQGLNVPAAAALLAQRLRVASFRYGPEARYPDGSAIPNHAKTLVVDDTVFYIGSQNLYPANLAEFGWLVEDATLAADYVARYWQPVWQAAFPTVTGDVDQDVEATQEMEGVQFVLDLDQHTRMARVWNGLLARYRQAAPEEQARLGEAMDELVANAGYATSADQAMQALQTPFFSQRPPAAEPTAEAIRFVLNLMNSPELMAAFAHIAGDASDTAEAVDARMTAFLQARGYRCNALEVLAAFAQLRRRVLVYWVGSYTTWTTDDGGATYAVAAGSGDAPAVRAMDGAGGAGAALPENGPALEIAADGTVTLDGQAIANPAYDDNCLSWQAEGGNDSAGTLYFGLVARATLSDDYTGAECYGTVAWRTATAGRPAGTYSFYARDPAALPARPGSTDRGNYTVVVILGALALAALALVGCRFAMNRASASRAWYERGRRKRAADDVELEDLEPVRTQDRAPEIGMLRQRRLVETANQQEAVLRELATFESAMDARQLRDLGTAGTRLNRAREAFDTSTMENLREVVQEQGVNLASTQKMLGTTYEEIQSSVARSSRTQIDEALQDGQDGLDAVDLWEQEEAEDAPLLGE